jgi:chromate transport protein ChrA
MSNLYSNLTGIAYAVMFAGMIVVIFTTGVSGGNALTGLITGYASTLAAVMLVVGIIMYNTFQTDNRNLYNLIYSIFPFILVIIIITIFLILLTKYSDRITNNKVSDYYYSFSNASTIFLIAQLWIMISAISDKNYEKTNVLSSKTFATLMLLGVINSIIVITLGVILSTYITDC